VRFKAVIFDLFDTLLPVRGATPFMNQPLEGFTAFSLKRALTFPLRSLSEYILRLEMKCTWKLDKAWKSHILACAFRER